MNYYKAQELVIPPKFIKINVFSTPEYNDSTHLALINSFDIKSIYPHYKGTKIYTSQNTFYTPHSFGELEGILTLRGNVDENC